MGRHASADRRRSVAAWPIVTAAIVLAVVLATVGYLIVVNSQRDTASCTASTVLPVAAAPGAATAVRAAAAAFNATHPVARSTCVTVSVSTVDGASAATSLATGWKDQQSAAPGLWVADSTADVNALDAAASAMTAGHATAALATSPVVIAVRTAPAGAVSWSGIAGGTVEGLRLTMPAPRTNRATRDALESVVAAASTGTGVVDAAAVRAADTVLTRMAATGSPAPATTGLALEALADGTAEFTAVPVVESDLAAFNATAKTPLTALYPTGRTAGDDILPIPLTAGWVSNAMSDAAAAFDSYLGEQGSGSLAAAHLRTGAASSTAAPAKGVDLATPVTALDRAGPAAQAALISAWDDAGGSSTGSPSAGAVGSADPPDVTTGPGTAASGTTGPGATGPGTTAAGSARSATAPTTIAVSSTSAAVPSKTGDADPPAITFLLDTSDSMRTVVDGEQRIAWLRAAVNATVQRRAGDLFAVWSFSTTTNGSGFAQLVPLGGLTEPVDGTTRLAAITGTVSGLQPSGNSWTYAAIRAVFTAGAAPAGSRSTVLVLTDGADSTPQLPRAALVAAVAAVAARNPTLELDIVGLSDQVDAQAMTEIAQAGHGRYLRVGALSSLTSTLASLAAG